MEYYEMIEVINKADVFINEGYKYIRPELETNWLNLVETKINDSSKMIYNGIVLEIGILCMNSLSEGLSAEEVYKLYLPFGEPVIYADRLITPILTDQIVELVHLFHVKGEDFYNYHQELKNITPSYTANYHKRRR